MSMIHIQNYIDGAFSDPIQNEWLDNVGPADGLVYGKIPNSSSKDVQTAYEAAQKAFIFTKKVVTSTTSSRLAPSLIKLVFIF